MVDDNRVWEAVMPYYYIDDDFCKARGINDDLSWLIMNHLCEPVDDDKD